MKKISIRNNRLRCIIAALGVLTVVFSSLSVFLYVKYILNRGKRKTVKDVYENEKLQPEGDNNKFQDEINLCSEQIEELNDQDHAAVSDSMPSVSSDNPDENSDASSEIVYWSPAGKVYHSTTDCPGLGRSGTICSGTISESGKDRKCKMCF